MVEPSNEPTPEPQEFGDLTEIFEKVHRRINEDNALRWGGRERPWTCLRRKLPIRLCLSSIPNREVIDHQESATNRDIGPQAFMVSMACKPVDAAKTE